MNKNLCAKNIILTLRGFDGNPVDPKQIISPEELLMFRIVRREAFINPLLAAKEVDNPKSREGMLNQIGKEL